MDPSVTGIELRCLRHIGNFYLNELACWKVTNAKMFLISATTVFGLIANVHYFVDDLNMGIPFFLALFGSSVCFSLEMCGILHRVSFLRDFYIRSVIEPEQYGHVKCQ